MLGLDGAGKTTIIFNMKLVEVIKPPVQQLTPSNMTLRNNTSAIVVAFEKCQLLRARYHSIFYFNRLESCPFIYQCNGLFPES